MTAADSFNLVLQDKIDPYQLLPAVWQSMSSAHKHKAMSIYEHHNKEWNVSCILRIMKELVVTFDDVIAVQMGLWHAVDDPSHLDRGMEDEEVVLSASVPEEVEMAEEARKKATDGLSSYHLHPEGKSGNELFNHAIACRLRKYSKDQKNVSCTIFLIVNISLNNTL